MGQEAVEGVVELTGDDPSVVDAMLQFMYTFEYDWRSNDQEQVSPMLFDVRVYGIAEKYGVSALKVRAKEKFEAVVKKWWHLDDFSHSVVEIYRSTPSTDRGLRDIAVSVACEHISELLKNSSFNDALEEIADFAADITQLLANSAKKEQSDVKRYKCPYCDEEWETALIPRCNCVLIGWRG